MEVTKRFLWFLQELENPSVQQQYTAGELKEYLKQIREKLGQISAEEMSNASIAPSLEDLGLLEQTILGTCEGIYVKLKETLDHLCRMHVHATNFPLDAHNVIKFLTVYCNALFESTKISLLSEDAQAPSFLRMVDGESSGNENQHQELIMELDRYMDDEDIRALVLDEMPLLEGLLKNKDYLGNIGFKIGKGSKPLYLILHFKNDSPFTGYFIAGTHCKDYPLCLDFITTVVETATRKLYAENKDNILRSIETIMIEIIQLQKNYFLSFVASEVQTALCCDVPTSLNIVEEESKTPTKTKDEKEKAKSVEITLLQHNRLEIRANFDWNNAKLNTQLSAIWGKLQGLSKTQEERNYYRTQLKATNSVFLQFNQKGTLIYQSDILPDEYNSIIEINNFLSIPTARSMNVALGKNKKFLLTIQDIIRTFQESKTIIPDKDVEFEHVHFKVVCKRNEWNKTFDGFCLAFDKYPAPREISPTEEIENIILDLERNDSAKRMKGTFKKMKVFLGHQPSQDASSVLGENLDLEKLKKTIVSEYLPEELTRASSDSMVVSKAISAVRKIKIEMTPGTAFKQLVESPPTRFAAFAITKANSNPVELRRPEKFTKGLLSNGRKDAENLSNWSYDISAISEWTEKSRLVWAILNQGNLIKQYDIDLNKLCEFVSQVKDGYSKNNNPYHNYDHGVTVMHATNYIMKNLSTRFSSLVNLGMLIAAFCHDVDHTGRTNLFEVNSGSELAIRYHDRAVLEQHHAAVTFQILNKEACNIFSQIKKEDRKELRKLIIANILATDMKEHFELMKNFRELNTRIKAVEDDSFVYTNDDIQLLTGMIVHCADLSGATKDFSVSLKWSTRVNEEFSTQVREEAALDIPVTPYFKDLDKKEVMAKQEIAFIQFMVKPVWELFNDFCGGSMKVATTNIEKNLKEWNLIMETALMEIEPEKEKEKEKPAEDKQIKQEIEKK